MIFERFCPIRVRQSLNVVCESERGWKKSDRGSASGVFRIHSIKGVSWLWLTDAVAIRADSSFVGRRRLTSNNPSVCVANDDMTQSAWVAVSTMLTTQILFSGKPSAATAVKPNRLRKGKAASASFCELLTDVMIQRSRASDNLSFEKSGAKVVSLWSATYLALATNGGGGRPQTADCCFCHSWSA